MNVTRSPANIVTHYSLRTSVLVVGGMWGLGRPETREINYATRVKAPTLMLSGKYDTIFPLDTTVKPMFDLLGTPTGQKQLRVYESDHFISFNEVIKETLAWLDRYLGPVKRPAGRSDPCQRRQS